MSVVIVVGPDTERLLFVDVGLAHGHGNGEDGDVHHDQITDLDGGMEVSDVDNCESGGAGCGRLE